MRARLTGKAALIMGATRGIDAATAAAFAASGARVVSCRRRAGIGQAVAWLACDESSHVTGVTLAVDGGYTLS